MRNFKLIYAAIARDKPGGGNKYRRDASKEDYKEVDHYAYYLKNMIEVNRDSPRGISYEKGLSHDEMEVWVWQISVPLCIPSFD